MAKAPYTKGQQVVLFGDWNREGMFWFKNYTVASCGVKQMTLIADDGTMAKYYVYAREYLTNVAPLSNFASVEEIQAHGVQMAKDFLADDLKFHIAHRVGNPSYVQSEIMKRTELLKAATPQAERLDDLRAAVAAKYAA